MITNPFRPGFGVSPFELGGRQVELSTFMYGLFGGVGSMQRALLVSGSRGVGKTVLLNEFERQAREQGWVVVRAYPDAEMISRLRDSTLPQAYYDLDQSEPPRKRTVTGIGISSLGSVTTQVEDRDPAPTLLGELRRLAEIAQVHGVGVLITLDELQAARIEDLAQLATAMQDLVRDNFDIAFATAGLTFGVEALLEHPGTTFMRRAQRLELGGLSDTDVAEALTKTAAASGREFEEGALLLAVDLVQGYPFLLQLVGSLAWAKSAMAGDTSIKEAHVLAIAEDVKQLMGIQVHKIALKAVPDGEMEFLRTMAQLETEHGPDVPISLVAAHMGRKPNGISVWRRNLIERDLVTPPSYGYVRFAMPYMGEYLRSVEM